MVDILIAAAIGFVAALVVVWVMKRKFGGSSQRITIYESIQRLKSVGELVVFKLVTRQIVTAEEHSFGKFGKEWLRPLLSTKKLALIIEYGVDFKYDLRDRSFEIQQEGPERFRIHMPACLYHTYVRDVKFYDERNARILPWLLGDVTEILGARFDEEDKNRLLAEARRQADQQARETVNQFRADVQSSARSTLEALAKSFGAEQVTIEFSDATPEPDKDAAEPAESALRSEASGSKTGASAGSA